MKILLQCHLFYIPRTQRKALLKTKNKKQKIKQNVNDVSI